MSNCSPTVLPMHTSAACNSPLLSYSPSLSLHSSHALPHLSETLQVAALCSCELPIQKHPKTLITCICFWVRAAFVSQFPLFLALLSFSLLHYYFQSDAEVNQWRAEYTRECRRGANQASLANTGVIREEGGWCGFSHVNQTVSFFSPL